MHQTDVLQELEALGTAQNRKIYRRHGVGDNQYGVSYANLETLRKQINVDQNLAEHLWLTGNHDARVLATKIADPTALTPALLDDWATDLDSYVLADAFSGLAAQTPFAREKMESWTLSDDEWTGRAGWQVLAYLAMHDHHLPDALFEGYLEQIEREIHDRKNKVRDAMNSALIAIGLRNEALRARAVAAAERIGPVHVDHGQTSCKTPDAVEYIHKAAERNRRRKRPR